MKIVLHATKNTPEVFQVARDLKKLIKAPHELCATNPIASKAGIKKSGLTGDVIMPIGGDGTVLNVMRKAKPDIPLFPIHMGRVGFLTDIGPADLKRAIPRVLREDYFLDRETKLLPSIGKKKYTEALNEVAAVSAKISKLCTFDVAIDSDHYSTFDADGVIVSTPTGSTAYSMSAGGPILDPEAYTFVVVPLCPYTLTARPLVVPDDAKIKIKSIRRDLLLAVDGETYVKLKEGKTLTIQKAENTTNFIRFSDSFYTKLDKIRR